MIEFQNDGPEITHTNYWDSRYAKGGYAFLSYNAGAARLLLPDALVPALSEMRPAEFVIISVGLWPEAGNRPGIELLFEDHSSEPYCLHLSEQEQSDRRLPATDQGGGFLVTIWTRAGKQCSLPGRFRKVKHLPCLEPWSMQ